MGLLKKEKSGDKSSDTANRDFPKLEFKNALSIIILVSIFGLILTMLVIHIWTINYMMTTPINNSTRFDRMEQANVNLFNILLPLFGAWVGTVIAFYFGRENLQTVYNAMSGSMEKMSEAVQPTDPTVGEVIGKDPRATKFVSAKLNENVRQVFDRAGDDVSSILIVDANDKPLGMLFLSDVNRIFASSDRNISTYDNRILQDLLTTETIIDNVTGRRWTASGVPNYVILDSTEKSKVAGKKLKEHILGLGVRGIVLNKDKKPYAIITYDMLFPNA
jgi:hypothetical protein